VIPPNSFIIHVDTTYKMSQRDYPVLVNGLSVGLQTLKRSGRASSVYLYLGNYQGRCQS
jgi:hypothetical protein